MTSRRFVFLHGPKSDSWYWHLVVPRIIDAGFEALAVDMPVEDDTKGLSDYAAVVAAALAGHPRTTLVTHSMAAFVAPMAAHLAEVDSMVLIAPMVPRPGESAGEWMGNTGQWDAARRLAAEQDRDPTAPFSVSEFYLHDVPLAVAGEFVRHTRTQSLRPFTEPWPLSGWPQTPTRCIVGRHDRLYPYEFQRRIIAERLGSVPCVVDGGHLSALSVPSELVRHIIADPC